MASGKTKMILYLTEWFNWFTVVMVYYGLTLNADALIPGNVYLNNVIGGLIEFPTYIMCIIILHYFGRRLPLALMFIFSGAMLFISLALTEPEVVNERNPSLGLGFAKTQKFGFLPKLFFNQNPNRNPSF